MKLHVSAPSNFRTLTPESSIGSKFRALTPTLEPTLDSRVQSEPFRLQMLQLQSMRYSGDEGTMIRTAPQWQVAWSIATMGNRAFLHPGVRVLRESRSLYPYDAETLPGGRLHHYPAL
jgi:hypothetical protein